MRGSRITAKDRAEVAAFKIYLAAKETVEAGTGIADPKCAGCMPFFASKNRFDAGKLAVGYRCHFHKLETAVKEYEGIA